MSEPIANLDRFKSDLARLISKGTELLLSIQAACCRDQLIQELKDTLKTKDPETLIAKLPDFRVNYQAWYSEACAVIRQILPDRLPDFVSHYQTPKGRKDITYANYTIEDYLQGLTISRGVQTVVGPEAAIPRFQQQYYILKSAVGRFESSLYDIRQIVQADLFDSELDATEELARRKFTRASGALAGVVLEKHLLQVCQNHQLKIAKRRPTISDLIDALKSAEVIDVPSWRFIQHLADIRNICDHAKTEPTVDQVNDLLGGTKKVIKTLV